MEVLTNYKQIKIIVFDFDGTLVDSNEIKFNAYYDIFPKNDDYTKIIDNILNRFREKSRYFIIKEILQQAGEIADIKSKIVESQTSGHVCHVKIYCIYGII